MNKDNTAMDENILWFQTGFEHITDLAGYDHMLFLLILCSVYSFRNWDWLILITAFTIGHCITLVLSVLNIIGLPSSLIEFAIPITILISAVFRWIQVEKNENKSYQKDQKVYAATLFFGLIHGLGFSNMLRSLLGSQTDILQPLLFFNMGLEVGQIVIVLFSLVTITSLNEYAHIPRFYLVRGIAIPVGFVSLWLMFERAHAMF
ncbi:hypothetical protein LBMAG26_11210 [Bacteroidota bacterium]|nr:hypothetical protein LBMAG26_11210 [Bacteroidota bacterium]